MQIQDWTYHSQGQSSSIVEGPAEPEIPNQIDKQLKNEVKCT